MSSEPDAAKGPSASDPQQAHSPTGSGSASERRDAAGRSDGSGHAERKQAKGTRRPPMSPHTQRIEGALEEAMARGDFDDLPGAGKPLKLPDGHDPNWWIKQRIEDGDVERDAMLPIVMLLRREHERIDDTLIELQTESQVREHLEDFNDRVLSDRNANPLERMLAPTVDIEARVERWREMRRRVEDERRTALEDADGTPQGARRRRWWWFPRRPR